MSLKRTIANVVAQADPEYRTWIYNRIDGEMQSKVVDINTAQELFDEGWRMSPAEFTEDEHLKHNEQFHAASDDMAQRLNFLLNLEKCEDKVALREFAEEFFQMKLRKNMSLKNLKFKVKEKAKELGLLEDDNS